MSIVITTPTGHIGSALVLHLLDAGRSDLVLLVRDASRLADEVRARVATREGVLQDADFVRTATEGADALFWLSPPDPSSPSLFGWYEALGASASGAVRANGIGHVVDLSSEGAQDRDAYGPVSGLGRVEAALEATEAAVRHLRPTFFFENFGAQAAAIRDAGAVFFPVPTTRQTGMIATADIARRAADLLLDLGWSGTEVVGLHGPRDLSYDEAAAALADALGRDVRAQEVPPEALAGQLAASGASPDWVDGFVRLYTSIGAPGYRAEPRTAETTTPTELADWARTSLRPALEAAA